MVVLVCLPYHVAYVSYSFSDAQSPSCYNSTQFPFKRAGWLGQSPVLAHHIGPMGTMAPWGVLAHAGHSENVVNAFTVHGYLCRQVHCLLIATFGGRLSCVHGRGRAFHLQERPPSTSTYITACMLQSPNRRPLPIPETAITMHKHGLIPISCNLSFLQSQIPGSPSAT